MRFSGFKPRGSSETTNTVSDDLSFNKPPQQSDKSNPPPPPCWQHGRQNVEAYLMKLPQSDRIEAMDYFKELFDDAGPEGEEDLIASLGSPKEAAHDI